MSQDQQTPVILEQHGAIAVITMSNPPLNTLSHSVRLGLDRVLTKVITDSEIKGAVLCGEGRAFCAGADVREFDQAPAKDNGETVLDSHSSGSAQASP